MATEGFADDRTTTKDAVIFDLAKEMMHSQQERPWPMGHFARTLFKAPDLRIVLISMDKGSILKEHHADGTISVQVLKGSIRFTTQGDGCDLQLNGVLTLGPSIKHKVEALEESAFLLTIAWPSDESLKAMKHRGYGT
jgi:quercetin dioxygenase-like cupin family protein